MKAWTSWLLVSSLAGSVVSAASCSSSSESKGAAVPSLTTAELQDPKTCAGCHPTQTSDWSGSMHAYASDDPVFLAMNKRAQRETNGAIGNFCVQCHAPVAVRTGATTDGSNLASLPSPMHGITCYFCHSVDSVTGTHNDPLHLASDGVMRAAIHDPISSSPHGAGYASLQDRATLTSSSMCGTCHDIHTPAGVDVATTYSEWQGTLFAHDVAGEGLSCGACHMPESDGEAANVAGAPTRKIHDHSMPGVDTALIDFPNKDVQATMVQQNLDPSLVVKLCISPPASGSNVQVTLDNAFVGHQFPSGASYDRRVWVEVVAYKAGQVVWSSGTVPPGTSVVDLNDPNAWIFRTDLLAADNSEAHFQWQAASAVPTAIPPTVTNDPSDPKFYHSITKMYLVPTDVDRVTTAVHIVPFDVDVLQDLVTTGDLDASFVSAVPTYTLAGSLREWTSDMGFVCVPAM